MTTIEFSIPTYMLVIWLASATISSLLRISNWFLARKLRKLEEECEALEEERDA